MDGREEIGVPWNAYPVSSTPMARVWSEGITFSTLKATTPTSICRSHMSEVNDSVKGRELTIGKICVQRWRIQ